MDHHAPRPFPHINSIIAEAEQGFHMIVWLRRSELDPILLADEAVSTLEDAHAITYRLGRERSIDPEYIEIRTKLATEHSNNQRTILDPYGASRFSGISWVRGVGRSGAAAVPLELHR